MDGKQGIDREIPAIVNKDLNHKKFRHTHFGSKKFGPDTDTENPMSLRKPKIRPVSGGERHENIFVPADVPSAKIDEKEVFNKTRSDDEEDYDVAPTQRNLV